MYAVDDIDTVGAVTIAPSATPSTGAVALIDAAPSACGSFNV